jgi:toxin CptA
MTSAPAIGFEYRSSCWLTRLPAAVLVLALLALASCGLAGWLKLLLATTATGLWLHALRHRSDTGVTAAGWAAGDGGWSLHRGGRDAPATLASFRVLGAVVLLRLREGDRRITTLLLAPDNSDADIRRRLRMRLAARQVAEAAPVC